MTAGPASSGTVGERRRTRRRLLWLGMLALCYPLLRFIGFRVPAKPRRIEINTTTPASGVLVHTDFLLFDRDGASWALPRKCTHLGCKVNFHEEENLVECPCHQSRFTIDGKVIHGPAKKDLVKYHVEKRDTAPFYIIVV